MLFKLGPNMFATIIFVLVATSATILGEEVQCRSGCAGYSPVPQTFKFAEGTTYQYGYEGVLDVSLSSSKGQQSETKVKATVLLTQQSECNQVLRVQGLQILGDSKKFGSIPDIEKPIRLNYHDGHLEDIICAENGDSQNSLNIKRAIASMFQAALKHHNTEIDVFGSCPTEFSSHKDGHTLVIKKARNLNKCSHRESIGQDYMSLTYDLTSDIKTSPLLQGSYNAEMKIKGGILDSSVVHEDYLYIPFSVGEEGAKVNVHSKLTFEKQTKEIPKYSCASPKSIIFENPHPTVSEKSISKALIDSIKTAANEIDLTLKETSAEKFSKIVALMRKSKKTELIAIYGQVRSGAGFNNQEIARRIFMDALFRAGTGECFEAVMEMYKNNELTDLETKLFFLRLSFVKHPTLGSIKGATELLGKKDLPREATIGLGNLIGKYCQQHSCDNVPVLNEFLNKLLSKLAKPTKANEDQVLASLKAILNSHKTTPGIESKLIELAQDKSGPLRIRSAALEAFKSNSCSEKLRDGALNILNDMTQDAEIRIEAYLSLVECPNGKVAGAIKSLLEKETSYQVGGFIVSHLRTLRTSTNPDKALAKSQLENIRTTKKFPVDWFKYSRNIEISNRWDSIGLGGSMEANLIYSPKSFMPTATHLNLTTQLFGHTFNFLEIDTRQENMDDIIAHYLGPLGVLRKESPNNLFKHGQGTFKKIADKIGERVNKNIVKREASKQQLETFGKTTTRKENELNKDIELDLSIKMFGSEALFLSISEDITKYTPEALVDKIFDKIDAAVNKLKGFDENLNANLIFLDTDISYPTSIGFPLKLSVEGVSSMHLKTSGKLELGKLLGRGEGEYKVSLIPSANIEITSKMVVETPVVERGLKLIGNLFTATGVNIDLVLSHNNIDLKYSLPVDKQDVITATHEIIFESVEVDGTCVKTPLKQPQAKDVTVCLDQLNPYLGVVVCAHLNQPNIMNDKVVLPYPLNGNSKLSITVENSDLGMIHFTAKKFDGVADGKPKTGVEFETKALCKQNKLKSALKTEIFARPETYFLTTFTSDKKKASAELRAVITETENSIFARAKIDEIEYYAKIGGSISGAPPREIYKPIMEYKAGTGGVQKSPYRLEGQIIKETSGGSAKFIFDNLQAIGGPKPIKITGNVASSPYSLEGDVSLSDGQNTGKLKGKVHYKDQQLNLHAMVETNFNPNTNFDVMYVLKTGDNTIDSKFQFQHGDFSKKENTFKLNNLIKRDNPKEILPFETKNSMIYSKLGIDNEFDLTLTEKTVGMKAQFGYQKLKLKTELDAKVNQKNVGDYDIEFEFSGFENKIELDLARAVDRTKSKLKNTLEINGKAIKLNGDVTHNFEANKIDFVTDLNLKIVGFTKFNSDLKINTNLKWNPQDTDGSLKVSDSGKVLIDAFIKQSKGGNANGSLKVTIPSVTMQGQLKASKYSGTSSLTIDITDVRKMKADSTFNVNSPTFNLDLTLYTNVGKDDSRKYRIATTSVFKKDSIDSKNILDILGKSTSFNIKGSGTGDIKDGKTDGEFDLTLPNDLYFAGKINRDRKEVKGVANGNMFLSFEQRDNKNAPGRKISIKGVGKNVNHQEGTYDIVYNVILENGNGKNVNVDLDFKGTKSGGKHNLIWLGNIHGAALTEGIKTKLSLTHGKDMGEFLVHCEHGASTMLHVKGNLDHHHADKSGMPCTGAIEVELKTPLSKLKVFKLKSDGKVLIPMQKGKNELEILNNFSMFLDDDGTDPNPTVDIEMKNDWKLGEHKGKIISNINLKGKDPVDIDLSYDEEPGKKYNYKGNLKCGSHFDKWDVTFDVISKDEINSHGKLETSRDICKNLNIDMKYKYNRESKVVSDNWKINYNGKNYDVSSSVGLSEHYPLFSVEVKYPDGSLDKIYTKFNNVGVRSVSAEAILKFHKIPFEFSGKADVHAESIEDFDLKLEVDSPQLKLNKIVITANTKETKGSNKLMVTMKKGNENLISGNALYKTRQEDNKFIVEGSGTFTIKNDKKTGNFKYTKKNLLTEKDNEDGVEFSLQGTIGDKGLDSEIKITDKHRRALLSFCEQKKECANVEMDAKTTTEGEGYKSTLEMNVDLRKLGLSHEFGMKAITKVQEWDLDHTVDLHFQSQKSKYSYGLYLHPNKAGCTITTPKRIVSLQSELNRPKLGEKGPIKGEIAFYLNKKTKPNEKAALTFTINPEFSDKITNLEMEAKLIHPALKKPMTSSYKSTLNLENPYKLEIHSSIDVIPNSDKKIIGDVKGLLKQNGGKIELSHTFDFDVQPLKLKLHGESLDLTDPQAKLLESKFALTAILNGKKTENLYHELYSPNKIVETLKINNQIVYDFNLDRKHQPDGENLNLDLQLIGLDKILGHLETKKLESIKIMVTNPSKNPKLEINSAFIPNQLADFRVDLHKDGKKIDFVHANIKLDEKDFLKSDYSFQPKHVKEHFVEPAKKASQKILDASKNSIKKSTDDTKNFLGDLSKSLKENESNLKPIINYYEKELKTIKSELESDETLKKISEILATVIHAWVDFVNSMTMTGKKFAESMDAITQKYITAFTEMFEKEMLPKLKDIADKLTDSTYNFAEKLNEIAFGFFEQITTFVEAHKEELKQIASVISSTTQDVNRVVVKVFEDVKMTVTKEWERILEEVKALPYYEQIKMIIEKIQSGEPVPQQYIDQFQAIANEIKNQIPLPPFQQLIDYTTNYIVKKMKRQDVNDLETLQHIIKMLVETIKEVAKSEGWKEPHPKMTMPLSARIVSFLPKLVAFRMSWLNRILSHDDVKLEELIMDFTLNPLSWIPPYRRYAITAQGQHIFTFDGKHLTFPGKCNYMLASDIEGKFSIAGTYTNGIMTELTFFDKTDTFTIKKSGVSTFNGAATELPIRTKLTDVYRLYTHVEINSKAGVRILCLPDLSLCVFSVSGFYHDRLRGLLGNPNFEKNDDFVLPDGKVVESESEFGNSYKLQTDCPAIKTVDHSSHHSHQEECTKLFAPMSTLSACYDFVKPDLFKQACDHGLAAKVPNTLEAIAMAYSATCQTRYIPAFLPKEFVKCTNSDKTYNLGDTFSVKTPQKSADIVFVIDVTDENKAIYSELVMPLGESLKKELSDRGIKDVEYHIITYGGDQPDYPSHITTNGGKMTFKGKFPHLKFTEKHDEDDIETGVKQLDFSISLMTNYWRDLKLALGETPQEYAFDQAIEYPFRAHATKAIIAVTTSPCETGTLIWAQKLRALFLHNPEISLNIFTPMTSANFKVKDDKTTKNVIGFNKNYVMTVPDCKKNPVGNPDLLKEVSYNDFCSEFAAMAGGNVFVLENFVSATKPNKKFYEKVAVYNIAESMLSEEQHLDCKCTRETEHYMTGVNECTVVETKKRPASKRKLTRG